MQMLVALFHPYRRDIFFKKVKKAFYYSESVVNVNNICYLCKNILIIQLKQNTKHYK